MHEKDNLLAPVCPGTHPPHVTLCLLLIQIYLLVKIYLLLLGRQKPSKPAPKDLGWTREIQHEKLCSNH